jgi:hypothetical protein
MVVKLETEIVQDCAHWKRVMWRVAAYGKLPAHRSAPLLHGRGGRGQGLTDFGTCVCQAVEIVSFGAKTFETRECYLLRVVDLPDDGLPTSPMSGSRGIVRG